MNYSHEEKYLMEKDPKLKILILENQHIKVKRDKIIIDFIGKKGVRNECEVKNKKIIKTLKKIKS